MKRCLMLLLSFLLLLSMPALGEETMINLIENPDAEYAFAEGAPILEVVFPRVYSSDCIVLRMGDQVMMVDASTKNTKMRTRIQTALNAMGVDHIDVAFNSHPHDDHIDGFQFVHEYCPIGKLLLTFPEDFNGRIRETVKYMNEHQVPLEHVGDGDQLTLGAAGEVTLTVIQRKPGTSWTENDRSALLLVRYGDRTMLLTGDIENRAQKSYGENPPEGGIQADILKYPHHGQVKLRDDFLAAVSPELVFMNGAADVMNGGKSYLNKKHIPYLLGYKGLTRFRTDGEIWVVDYLDEPGADR